jgi:hypothetical protein
MFGGTFVDQQFKTFSRRSIGEEPGIQSHAILISTAGLAADINSQGITIIKVLLLANAPPALLQSNYTRFELVVIPTSFNEI